MPSLSRFTTMKRSKLIAAAGKASCVPLIKASDRSILAYLKDEYHIRINELKDR
jgi:hypothetical protein